MRIIFMGTPEFATPTLERLLASRHEVVLVVTQPDRPAGRGKRPQAPPVKHLALEHGLEVYQPERLRAPEVQDRLRAESPDVFVVVAYGKILPKAVLEIPRLGCINVHASLLPRYRGAAPVNWAVANGEARTGVTIMQMDEGMDTGDILKMEEIDILDDDDAVSVSNMLSVLGADRLLQVLARAEESGELVGDAQDEGLATYAPLLKKEDGRIDWSQPTDKIVCLVRGMLPWPVAHTGLRGKILRVLRAEPLWPTAVESIPDPTILPPGTVSLLLKSHGFAVRTGDGFVLVTQAQPSGKKSLSGVDLVNGGYVRIGDLLRGEWEEAPKSE